MTIYRMAIEADADELAQMRWDFRLEEASGATLHDQASFLQACAAFVRQGLREQRWTYWVAQQESQIVSHIYIQRVPKVPKPNKLNDALGYVTNVYTRPAYRGQGIGTQLMTHVLAWAQEQDLESLIVWPSEASVGFYTRAGFRGSPDMLEYAVRPYVL
jgi:ribosomal protein S18 acetylase RimI-like enzyme